MTELDYKKYLKSGWGGFSCSVEFGLGARAGFPDLLFKAAWSCTFLVESKLGIVKGDLLKFTAIRPEQFSWLRDFCEAGGKAFVFVGVSSGKTWESFVLPVPATRRFKIACINKKVEINETFRIERAITKDCYNDLLAWERKQVQGIN